MSSMIEQRAPQDLQKQRLHESGYPALFANVNHQGRTKVVEQAHSDRCRCSQEQQLSQLYRLRSQKALLQIWYN
jgi:hypothetical protein